MRIEEQELLQKQMERASMSQSFIKSVSSFNEKKEARASTKGQIKKALQRVSYLFFDCMLYALYASSTLKRALLYFII